ncbi:MAG TPA: alkaline phosphatase family protein [Acidobacteriaceae bacterium]|jgi:phospholipase C|nr:alkaline phosphatase family protein [Acidobacteriaceae bacterium]
MALNRNLPGIQALKHVVVLMMENRSFDHMLGALKAQNPAIDGLTGNESNPDNTGAQIKVQPLAEYQSQLDPDPNHHFAAVNLQIFNDPQKGPPLPATMQGFIKSYFNQQQNTSHSHDILYYFTPDKLPVLTTLASNYAVFNRWFASIPGPTICNRAFAHYGTSFGQVSMDVFYEGKQYKAIYDRMLAANHTCKLFYYDEASSTMEVVNLLQNEPAIFGTFQDFLTACNKNALPDYCFIEPNYTDHDAPDGSGEAIACDQHPDHDVRAGEQFIATVYNAIRQNPSLWPNTALLIVYDEHGGIYDHVPPPACTPDGFVAQPTDTGTLDAFHFDRLGVRVPAILVSPWVQKGSVINDVFEHASIPGTVTDFFIGDYPNRSPREIATNTFLGNLSLNTIRDENDCPSFAVQKS